MVRDSDPSGGDDRRRVRERTRPDEPRATADDPRTERGETRPAGRQTAPDEMRPEDPRSVYDDLPGRDRYNAYGEVPGEEDGGRSRDRGLIAVLFLAGVALLLFPEPATSVVGVSLIALAIVAAAIEWLR